MYCHQIGTHQKEQRMKMLLPKEMITWLDINRGDFSRQAFIIRILQEVINSKHSNTYGDIYGNRITREQGRD